MNKYYLVSKFQLRIKEKIDVLNYCILHTKYYIYSQRLLTKIQLRYLYLSDADQISPRKSINLKDVFFLMKIYTRVSIS